MFFLFFFFLFRCETILASAREPILREYIRSMYTPRLVRPTKSDRTSGCMYTKGSSLSVTESSITPAACLPSSDSSRRRAFPPLPLVKSIAFVGRCLMSTKLLLCRLAGYFGRIGRFSGLISATLAAILVEARYREANVTSVHARVVVVLVSTCHMAGNARDARPAFYII